MTLPSEFDNLFFPVARAFINETRLEFIKSYLQPDDVICDIGNQGKNIPELQGRKLVTLDITPDTGPDIVADITRHNAHIPDGHFDALLCTEVLDMWWSLSRPFASSGASSRWAVMSSSPRP
jgi:hypothetical protein